MTLLHAEDEKRICTTVQLSLQQMWPSSYGECGVQLRTIDLREIRSLVHCARRYRLDSARALLEQFLRQGFAPYVPVSSATCPLPKTLVPPVVEQRSNYFNLIDGVHRTLAALQHGLKSIVAVTVTSETLPTPSGDLCSIANVSVSAAPRTPDQLFRNLDTSKFEPVGYGYALETTFRRLFGHTAKLPGETHGSL